MSAEKNVDQSASAAAQAFMEEGNAFVKAKKFNDAIEKYNEAIKLHPDPLSFCYRAAAYIHLQQYDLAIQDCQTALQLDDKCAKAYGKMGLVYYQQKRYDVAFKAHETALALDPFYMLDGSYKNEMDTIQKNVGIAKEFCSFVFGGNGGIDEFLGYMNNNFMRDTVVETMKDPIIQKYLESMMEQFMGGAAGTNGSNHYDILTVGQNMMGFFIATNNQLLKICNEHLAAAPVEEQSDNNASSPVNTAESYESLY